jgi:hypothetical protein
VNVGELKAALDDWGDHLQVVINVEDENGDEDIITEFTLRDSEHDAEAVVAILLSL